MTTPATRNVQECTTEGTLLVALRAMSSNPYADDVVDVELVVSHAPSTCIAIALQCDDHDGGSPHLQHDREAHA